MSLLPWNEGAPGPQSGLATYLGKNEAGYPEWEIEGQVYTDSVSTVGRGAPQIGRGYPAWCKDPDNRAGWVALVREGRRHHPRAALSEIDTFTWATFMQGPRRSPRVEHAPVMVNNTFGSIVGTGSANNNVLVRIADGKLYIPIRSSGVDTLGRYNNSHLTAPTHTYVSPGVIVDMAFDETNADESARDLYIIEWNTTTAVTGQNTRAMMFHGSAPGGGYTSAVWNMSSPWPSGPNFGSRVTRLKRADLSVMWHSPWQTDHLLTHSPSLMFNSQQTHALAIRRDGGSEPNSTFFYLHLLSFWQNDHLPEEPGADPIPAGSLANPPVRLQMDNIASTAPKGEYTPTDSYDNVQYTQGLYGSGGTSVDDPLYYNFSGNLSGQGSVSWRASASGYTELSYLYNLLWWPNNDVFVPGGRYLQQLNGYRLTDGSRKWTVKGHTEGSNTHEFYSPIVGAKNGRLLVFTTVETLAQSDWSYLSISRRRRYCVRRQYYFDVYSAFTGVRIRRVNISPNSVSSIEHVPTGPTSSGYPTGGHPAGSRANGDEYPDTVFRNNWGGYKDPVHGDEGASYGGGFRGGWPNIGGSAPFGGFRAGSNYFWTGNGSVRLNAQQISVTVDFPPRFDPFSACLDWSGERIIFGPWWRDGVLVNDEGWISRGRVDACTDIYQMGANWQLGQRVWLWCYDWNITTKWTAQITASNPANRTFSNFVAYAEDRIAFQFRQGSTAFVWLLNTENGSLVQQNSYTGFGHNTTGDIVPLPAFDCTARERLYSKNNAFFTTAGNFVVTLRGGV